MQPTLWGPVVWQVMFACAWHCPKAHLDTLVEFLLVQTPLLLPCAKCRHHFATHVPRVHRRSGGLPTTAAGAFRWLWFLKDEVNKTLHRPSVPLKDITQRFVLHGGLVDEVALGDVLVLMALEATHLKRETVFVHFCGALDVLLPLAPDSQLRLALRAFVDGAGTLRSIPALPTSMVRVARAARVERGLPSLTLAHYRSFAAPPSSSHPR